VLTIKNLKKLLVYTAFISNILFLAGLGCTFAPSFWSGCDNPSIFLLWAMVIPAISSIVGGILVWKRLQSRCMDNLAAMCWGIASQALSMVLLQVCLPVIFLALFSIGSLFGKKFLEYQGYALIVLVLLIATVPICAVASPKLIMRIIDNIKTNSPAADRGKGD